MEPLTDAIPRVLYHEWEFGDRNDTEKQERQSRLFHEDENTSSGYYSSVRWDVISMVPPDVKSVMEVGCAAGGTGRALREMGVDHLIGIELNPGVAEIAGRHYDRVMTGDAETLDMGTIEDESLDCILYPDVLEHLRDPWSVFSRNLRLLRPGGYVVASIPNIRYYRAVQGLVFKGEWTYRDAGILDRGHLRFFTLQSIQELFLTSGLEILSLRTNDRGSYVLKIVNALVMNKLAPFLTKQYLVLGQKVSNRSGRPLPGV